MLDTIIETIQRDSIISFPFLWDIHLNPPASFTVLGRTIYFYGIIIALGFILGTIYCARRAPRFGFVEDDVYDSLIALIPCSLIGARIYFVAFQWSYFSEHPAEIIEIWNGGIAIYGGIIAGVITLYVVARVKKKSPLALMDLIIFGLLIGQMIGRWGNFMNREAFGSQTDIFCRMGLTAPDGTTIYVHPTFLYESLWNLIGFTLLSRWAKKPGNRRYDGQCMLLYLLWYGCGRSWIELLRTDSLYIGSTGIRVSSLLSVIVATVSLCILLINKKKFFPPEAVFVNTIATDHSDATD